MERLQSVVRDRRANWHQSLSVLSQAKEEGARVTKTSLMLGCGESSEEVIDAFRILRQHRVDVVTLGAITFSPSFEFWRGLRIGQYMRPTKRHMAVEEYVTPDAFDALADVARRLGFLYVASGPLVRSSYRAGEYYLKNVLNGENQE